MDCLPIRRAGGRRRFGECLAGALAAALVLTGHDAAAAGAPQPPKPVACADAAHRTAAEVARRTERHDGLFELYLDHQCGRVLAGLKPVGAAGELGEYLYQVYLRTGVGSTPIGLDRSGPANTTQIIRFRRIGQRVFAQLQNNGFRASAGGAAEQAVHDSFAVSTLWSGPVEAQAADGTVIVDLSSFVVQDNFHVVDALRSAQQGKYALKADLSYPDPDAAQVFPDNVELEAHQTFVTDAAPGSELNDILPEPRNLTLIEHHSFIRLPAPGYVPRLADPRVGAMTDSVTADYSAPLGSPVVYTLAHRFRLQKTDPTAARSPVRKPIIFYIDPAAPEPIRSALREGAQWWAAAFDAAGFIDAFHVEILPPGVSPLDARYNVINWVHRQTRGWSYGQQVIDPRSGEVVKGAVLLGSLRVRQDIMIFQGLVGVDHDGSGAQNDPIRISLARLRQLAVHETGHALGLEHNFAGSTFDDRASVMDYPAPRIRITQGGLDFADAYRVGIGSWDRFAIHWLYDEAPPGTAQAAALEAIIRDGYAHGMRFVTDNDARRAGSSHPYGALWDDGTDAVSELDHVLQVRRMALQDFGTHNIPVGAPLSDLRRVIVPVYLFHRYEVDAVAKLIGGAYFTYAVNGDGEVASSAVVGSEQRRALAALLKSVEVAVLDLPLGTIELLSAGQPTALDKATETEVLRGTRPPTGTSVIDDANIQAPAFSLREAVDAAADITFADLLEPTRLNRVQEQNAVAADQLGLRELLATTTAAVFPGTADRGDAHAQAVRRYVQARLIVALATAAADKQLSQAAAAEVHAALLELGERLQHSRGGSAEDQDAAAYYANLILQDKLAVLLEHNAAHPGHPPGPPVGEDDWFSTSP